jgi:plasmid maintenance system antidote protein VapI
MEELLNLKAWMVVNKVTQKDFAKTLGVSNQTINNKINGRRSFTLQDIKKLNLAYGVEANTFL